MNIASEWMQKLQQDVDKTRIEGLMDEIDASTVELYGRGEFYPDLSTYFFRDGSALAVDGWLIAPDGRDVRFIAYVVPEDDLRRHRTAQLGDCR